MMQFEVEFARVVRLYYSRMQAQLAEVGLYRGQPPWRRDVSSVFK